MNSLFDTHLHLNHPNFAEDAALVWQKSVEMGVTSGVVVGYDLDSSQRAIKLTEQAEGLYAAVGISPHDVENAPGDYLNQVRKLALHPKAAAIGEIGLEYHYSPDNKENQRRFF